MSQKRFESVVVLECPACGRLLQARVELLGQLVACQHCGKGFYGRERDVSPSEAALDERADRLLALADPVKPPLRFSTGTRSTAPQSTAPQSKVPHRVA